MKKFLFAMMALGMFACTGGGGGGGGGSEGEAALGEACDSTSDCAAGQCISTGGDENFCSQACSANNPCPTGFECQQNFCMASDGMTDSDMGGVGGAGGGAGGEGGGAGGGAGGEGGGAGGAGGEGGGAGGAGGGGGEDLDCVGLIQCTNNCQDQTCVTQCLQDGTPEAAEQFNGLMACVQANCAMAEDINACANEQCGPEFNTCVGGGNPGDLSCSEINGCLNECGPDDQACAQECINDGSPEGFQQLQALITCADESGCFGDNGADQECIQTNCGGELTACFGGEQPEPMGDGTCSEFNACLNMCGGGDAACQQGCISDASPEAFATYQAIFTCGEMNGCINQGQVDQECLQANCSDETQACLGEAPQPMGDAGCNETLMCAGACGADEDCQAGCFEAASPEGFQLLGQLATCLQENMCEGLPCPACNEQVAACEAN